MVAVTNSTNDQRLINPLAQQRMGNIRSMPVMPRGGSGQPNQNPQSGIPQQVPSVPGHAMTRMLSPDQVAAREEAQAQANQPSQNPDWQNDPSVLEIAKHVRYRMYEMRNFRNMMGIGQRLIDALRTYKGQYDPARLRDIKAFGGSDVFARIVPGKCRGATSLLRDIYLGSERPWDISPTPEPEVPEDIEQAIQGLVAAEIAACQRQLQQLQLQAQQMQQQQQLAMQMAQQNAQAQKVMGVDQQVLQTGQSAEAAQAAAGTQQGPQALGAAQQSAQQLQGTMVGAMLPPAPQMPPQPQAPQGQPQPQPGVPWSGPLAPETMGAGAPGTMPQMPTQDQIEERVNQLREAARKAAKKNAVKEAKAAAEELDELLTTGNFYEAFAEFLIDLPIFPFAAIKGPVVRMCSQVKWVNGSPVRKQVPKMFWSRVSPFDLYWTPTAHNVHEAEFVERLRLTRADLLACKGLPGYNDDAISQCLDRFHDRGFREWWDVVDVERALLENREAWPRTSSSLIDTAEYHGSVSGKTLLEWGMDPAQIPDPEQEYRVTAWLIDRFVIKTQLDPTPSQRAPYYVSQFEKIPGTMYGYGLPDLLEDIQTVANASYRSLVNNMGIASGPQVVINDAVLAPGEDDSMYPWKRWHVSFDPMMASAGMQPIMFYQPDSRATEIQGLIANLNLMADDVSAIPRYMTGGSQGGGAGRTASGLSMLMSNAAKTLQNVAASIDRDVFEPMLKHLYETIMLTMPGVFRGDESVVVKGVVYAVKREQDRTRQLEFLNMTSNPTDMQIVGISGRSKVLGAVANSIGLDWDNIVPDDASMEAAQAQQQQEQQREQQAHEMQMAAQAQAKTLELQEHANLYAAQAQLGVPLPGTPGQHVASPMPPQTPQQSAAPGAAIPPRNLHGMSHGGMHAGQKPNPKGSLTTAQLNGTQQPFARRPGMKPGA
jgi:hypothetical protein